jgi:hypothetical protein
MAFIYFYTPTYQYSNNESIRYFLIKKNAIYHKMAFFYFGKITLKTLPLGVLLLTEILP